MHPFIKLCLIVCPLVFLGGFIDSVAGGGGLITLPAYLMAGIPPHIAMGTNKIVNGCGTATAALRYLKSGKIDITVALIAGISALIGSAIGTRIALWIPEGTLKLMMLIALPVVAVILVWKKDFGKEDTQPQACSKSYRLIASGLIGLSIGCYDGLIGPGTGTFMIMAFTAILSMDLIVASGCAKVGNLASNIASGILFILNGKVLWSIVIPAAICNAIGGYCGARYAIKGGSKKVRAMVFVVLGLLFAKMLYDLLS